MRRDFLYRASYFILICYLVASLSPRYVSAIDDSPADTASSVQSGERTLVRGIFWLNVVGSKLLASLDTDIAAPQTSIGSTSASEDMLLMTRRRAIHRERFTVVPVLTSEALACADASPRLPLFEAFTIPHDLIHCNSDDCSSLSTGLSPPLV